VTRPLLYIQDVLPQIDPDLVAEGSIDDKIQAGLDRLLSMQTPSGGFGIWPGDTEPVLWGTAYVVHLMLDAQKKGYRVPEEALKDAVDWLDRHAESQEGGPKFTGTSPGYVQYVLSRAGRPHTAIAARMLDALQNPVGPEAESQMLLQAALYAAGDRRHDKALRTPDVSLVEGRRHNDWSYYSDLRRRGLTLTVFHELFGAQASGTALAELVAGELVGRPSHGFNTQELMWGVSGLGKWVGKPGKLPAARLRFDGQVVQASRERSRASGELAWQVTSASLAQSVVLELDHAPATPLALIVTTEGTLAGAVPEGGDRGLHLERRWHLASGGSADPAGLVLGDLVYVELGLRNLSRERIENVALVDRIPAGWEIENPRLGRGALPEWASRLALWELDYMDLKDDRFMVFGGLEPGQTATVIYAVRATTAGAFTAPGAYAEAMYDPELWSRMDPQEGVLVDGPWDEFAR
jgi:uncharacterized protein YfaS (alpha-2-macroglobulin family)